MAAPPRAARPPPGRREGRASKNGGGVDRGLLPVDPRAYVDAHAHRLGCPSRAPRYRRDRGDAGSGRLAPVRASARPRRGPQARSSLRHTKRSPDQSSPTAATLTSTRPVGSTASRSEVVGDVAVVPGRPARPQHPQRVLGAEDAATPCVTTPSSSAARRTKAMTTSAPVRERRDAGGPRRGGRAPSSPGGAHERHDVAGTRSRACGPAACPSTRRLRPGVARATAGACAGSRTRGGVPGPPAQGQARAPLPEALGPVERGSVGRGVQLHVVDPVRPRTTPADRRSTAVPSPRRRNRGARSTSTGCTPTRPSACDGLGRRSTTMAAPHATRRPGTPGSSATTHGEARHRARGAPRPRRRTSPALPRVLVEWVRPSERYMSSARRTTSAASSGPARRTTLGGAGSAPDDAGTARTAPGSG